MNTRALLDADMTTVAGWLRQGLDWWLGELAEMVPDAVRRNLVRRRPALVWDGAEGLADPASGEEAAAGFGRADVVLPARLCLQRELLLPAMSRRDLDAFLALDAERIMPLPADRMLLASRPGSRSEAGRIVAVAGIARERIAGLLALLANRGVMPGAIRVGELDFLPAARAAGMVPRQPMAPQVWWAVAGLLALLNVATLVWRDVDRVERLQAMVDARRPLAMGARKAAQRVQARSRMVREAIVQRREANPLVPLAAVSAVLPRDAFVQRFAWDGHTLRLSGYKRGTVDVAKALRDSGRFEDVRNTSGEVQAELPVGQPFDVTLRARPSS